MEKQNKKSSKQRIKEALLNYKVLTNAMGFKDYGTTDFRKTISELRAEGLPIKSKRKADSACYEYWIEQPEPVKKPFISWLGVFRLGFGG